MAADSGDDTKRPHGKDKALSFHWRVVNTEAVQSLELPAAPSVRHEKARAAVVVDAIRNGLMDPDQFISYSRRKEFYAGLGRYEGTHYAYSTVPWAVDDLHARGFLDHDRAERGRLGLQSAFRATPALLEVVKAPLVIVQTAPLEPIVLRDADKRRLDYRDTEFSTDARRRIESINEATASLDIELREGAALAVLAKAYSYKTADGSEGTVDLARNRYHRVFNRTFTQGGRFYGPGWQSAPKEVRANIVVNGEATVEHDYRGLHPQLIYAKAGKTLEGDPYAIAGWEDKRQLVKRAFNIMLNAENDLAAVRAVALHSRTYAIAREVMAAIRQKHAPVAAFFCSGIGRKLQRIDSDIAEDVMLTTLRDGVAVLSVHDSFSAPTSYDGRLLEVMDAALMQRLRQLNPEAIAPLPGSPRVVLVIPHGAQADMFKPEGYTMPAAELDTWRGGVMPPTVREAIRHEIKRRGVGQDQVAAEVGISRPQLTNALQGRFGLSEPVAERVKAMLQAAAA